MVVSGSNLVNKLGVKRKELIPLANGINAANNQINFWAENSSPSQ